MALCLVGCTKEEPYNSLWVKLDPMAKELKDRHFTYGITSDIEYTADDVYRIVPMGRMIVVVNQKEKSFDYENLAKEMWKRYNEYINFNDAYVNNAHTATLDFRL